MYEESIRKTIIEERMNKGNKIIEESENEIVEPDWNYISTGKQANSTYEGVHKITAKSSNQWKWLDSHDWTYDDNDVCTYDGRTLVALTPIFGNIGDYVDLLFENGEIMKVIICDFKNNGELYGHMDGSYLNVIELIVSKSWYTNKHENIKYGKVIGYINHNR